jgi:gamma-carbonic anhydrase
MVNHKSFEPSKNKLPTPMTPHDRPFLGLLPTFMLPDNHPRIDPSAFIAPGAIVLGAAEIGTEASVWYAAVVRADINRIVIGAQSNAQDGVVLHVSDDEPCVVGQRVTIGHRAVVHACEIADEVLVGMGAIVLDGARIGARSIIAAGAVVPKNFIAPEGSLIMGLPARVVRALSAEEQLANRRLALKYVELSRRYRELGMNV